LYSDKTQSAEINEPPEIWLAPIDAGHTPSRRGSVDYLRLFDTNADWQQVSKWVSVFKIYHFFLTTAKESELRSLFDFLARHGIKLALEERVLTDDGDCKDDGGKSAQAAVARLHQLGAHLTYLAMDEPLFHWRGKQSCHASVDRIASNIAITIDSVRKFYPDIHVGVIEPIGQWNGSERLIPDALAFADAFETTTGMQLAFFHADVGWNTNWLPILLQTSEHLRRKRIHFGVIYNGASGDNTDEAWAEDTIDHFKTFEDANGGAPDAAIFQSWSPYPTHVLGEDNPYSITGLVRSYLEYKGRVSMPLQISPDVPK
jgi:hypothetical protein